MSNMLIVKYLTARYNEQCEKFPLTRDSVTLEGYIKANYQMAVRNLAKFRRGDLAMTQEFEYYLNLARKAGFPECHSIHCRHYDLAFGPCIIEIARTIYRHEELVARGQVQPLAEEV